MSQVEGEEELLKCNKHSINIDDKHSINIDVLKNMSKVYDDNYYLKIGTHIFHIFIHWIIQFSTLDTYCEICKFLLYNL